MDEDLTFEPAGCYWHQSLSESFERFLERESVIEPDPKTLLETVESTNTGTYHFDPGSPTNITLTS